MEDNNYNALPDGSLLYDKAFGLRSNYWMVDPENPRHYIPKVPVCTARKIELRVLKCRRIRSDWKCDLLKKLVSAYDCHRCTVCLTNQL